VGNLDIRNTVRKVAVLRIRHSVRKFPNATERFRIGSPSSYYESINKLGTGMSAQLQCSGHVFGIHSLPVFPGTQAVLTAVSAVLFTPSTQIPGWYLCHSLFTTHPNIRSYTAVYKSRDSSVSIVTGYGLHDQGFGVRVPVGARIFISPRRPDRLWGPSNLLSNGYRRLFPRR
jgi:hypothetical protein